MISYTIQTEKSLEFHLVLEQVYQCFKSEYGKVYFQQNFIAKTLAKAEVERNYTYLKEFSFLRTQFPDFGVRHIFDLNAHIEKLSIENYYIPREDLFNLYLLISDIRGVKSFFKDTTYQKEISSLLIKVDKLFYESALLRELERVLDQEGRIRSSASKELAVIRDRKRTIQSDIDGAFVRALNQAKSSGYLNEIEESWRQGRRVLAIQSAYKRSVKGIILDESETGNVVFMEPAETIYLNNEASDLEREEDRAIRKILIQITSYLSKYKNLIFQYQEFMAELDCIQALVHFMNRIEGSIPNIGNQLELNNAFHPLLKLKNKALKKAVIPFHLKFEPQHHLLIISGPNAGGKTVTLKTVGLIALMVQKGIPIPAEGDSQVPLYESVYGDLGDLQSIEDELSTYSSKLRLWNHMMKLSNSKSLILFDELGDGTDPSFGAAMAQSVLEYILDKKSTILATTHYSDLKKFSESRKDTFSASMLFDENKLEPLFKLSVGFPGSSYTFHIARKIGLSHDVIKRAEALSESEKVKFDRQLFKLEKKEKELHYQRKELEKSESELKKQMKDWNRLHLDMDLMRKKMRYEKTKLLQEQITEKERELNEFKKALKEKKKLEDLAAEQSRILEEKHETDKATKELYKEIHQVDPNQKLSIGDRVQFIQTNAIGIIEKMNKDKVTVIFEHMKSTISASELIWLPPDDSKKKLGTQKVISIDRTSSRELDVRGKFAFEALAELDEFINRALLNNFHEIKIIHGKGKLRTEIIQQLKNYRSVTRYTAALTEHGGDGVTWVYF